MIRGDEASWNLSLLSVGVTIPWTGQIEKIIFLCSDPLLSNKQDI